MRRLAPAMTFLAFSATCAGGGRRPQAPASFSAAPVTARSVDVSAKKVTAVAPERVLDSLSGSTQTQSVQFIAVGDLALSWSVGQGIEHGFDPFANVRTEISRADIAFANLETVLSDVIIERRSPEAYPPLIVGPQMAARTLASAGFDIVSVANNHALDLHAEGLRRTLASLASAGIASVGGGEDSTSAHRPFVQCVRGVCIGMLAFAFGTNERANGAARIALLGPESVDAVRALRSRVDVLLVSVHWGVEMTHTPRVDQVRLAHQLIDAGADAIIGHHPHVLQSVEIYRSRPIVYSLGNFVFGPMPAARRSTAMLEMDLTAGPSPVSRVAFVPIRLAGPRGAPLRADGPDAAAVRELLQNASAGFDTHWNVRNGTLEAVLPEPLGGAPPISDGSAVGARASAI